MQHSYTIWVKIEEQIFSKKKTPSFNPNDLHEITSFDTVQGFWEVYQHLRRPTAMPYGTTFNLFRHGIKPLWEDPSLQEGARFMMNLPKTHTSKYWEDLVIAMLGEQLGELNQVAGLVLILKPHGDKIAVWITNANDAESVEKLRKEIVNILKIEEKDLVYQVFKEIEAKKPAKPFVKKESKDTEAAKKEINTDW